MAFIERNYPTIYLYGSGSTHGDEQAAKVRIAFSRERDDRNRGEKAEGEWTCKIVGFIRISKHLSTSDLAIVYIRQLPRADKMSSLSKPTDK